MTGGALRDPRLIAITPIGVKTAKLHEACWVSWNTFLSPQVELRGPKFIRLPLVFCGERQYEPFSQYNASLNRSLRKIFTAFISLFNTLG